MQEWWVNMTGIYNGLVIKQPSHFSGDGLQVYSFLISDPCFTAGIGSTIKDPQLGTLRVAVQELTADGYGDRIWDTHPLYLLIDVDCFTGFHLVLPVAGLQGYRAFVFIAHREPQPGGIGDGSAGDQWCWRRWWWYLIQYIITHSQRCDQRQYYILQQQVPFRGIRQRHGRRRRRRFLLFVGKNRCRGNVPYWIHDDNVQLCGTKMRVPNHRDGLGVQHGDR